MMPSSSAAAAAAAEEDPGSGDDSCEDPASTEDFTAFVRRASLVNVKTPSAGSHGVGQSALTTLSSGSESDSDESDAEVVSAEEVLSGLISPEAANDVVDKYLESFNGQGDGSGRRASVIRAGLRGPYSSSDSDSSTSDEEATSRRSTSSSFENNVHDKGVKGSRPKGRYSSSDSSSSSEESSEGGDQDVDDSVAAAKTENMKRYSSS